MDANLYVSILEDELQKSLQYWGKNPEEVVFKIMTPNTLVKRPKPGWMTMDLRSWCGLLNPLTSILLSIYLWGHLKRKLAEYGEPPSSIQELWTRVQKEWDDIGEQECRNLIESMPRRVEAVLKAKGGHTKY